MNRGASSARGAPVQRGAGANAGRGGRGAGRGGASSGAAGSKEARAPILKLDKYVDQRIRVKFTGGREVTGLLKGFDQLLNLVLDEVEELIREPGSGEPIEPAKVRQLGLIVARGTAVVVINPVKGYEVIANPFLQAED